MLHDRGPAHTKSTMKVSIKLTFIRTIKEKCIVISLISGDHNIHSGEYLIHLRQSGL